MRKGYDFLDKVTTGVRYTEESKESSLQEFVESLRRDLRGHNQFLGDLCASEYRILTATSRDLLGPTGFTHIPFRIRNASKGQIVRIMTPVHMTQQDLERWQNLVQSGQWNYQDPPLDEWRSSVLQMIRTNAPTEKNSEMAVAKREQILSLNTEDLLLDEGRFLACKWTSKEPDTLIAFGNDQIQGLTKEP